MIGVSGKWCCIVGLIILVFTNMPEARASQKNPPPLQFPTSQEAPSWETQPPVPILSSLLTSPETPTGPARLFPQSNFVHVHGWIDGGYTFNTSSPTSAFNGPYNAIDRDILQLNQLYGVIEKPLSTAPSTWDVGFRADLLFGYDYFLPQSNGLEQKADGSPRWNTGQYGVAIPQLYAEAGYDRLSLKLGHFYTIVGYEGVPAPGNFFYSKSYAYQFAGPFTHWGGLTTWKIDPRLSLNFGVVNGWNALDRTTDRPGLLAGVFVGEKTDPVGASFTIVTGDEPSAMATQFENRTRYSAIITVNPTTRLTYVLHHHFAFQEEGSSGGGTARWYGIDQYLFYKLLSTVSIGGRMEWFRDEQGTRVGGSPFRGNPNTGPFAGSTYSLTGGINYSPNKNLRIRPEVRYDWFVGKQSPFNDGNNTNQVLLAINALVQF